jgi:DHA1 family bicyclomycin/chloramphenicol resistance-like MFS transporter
MFLLVGGLTTFGAMSIDFYLSALPAMGADLSVSTSAMQTSLTSCLLGMASGIVVIGPISDRLGRRTPLLFGLAAFVLASVLCAAAPSITFLVAMRFVQGFGAAAGTVIARAIVRDLYSGVAAARFFSMLVLVTGLSPLLSPQLGAFVLRFGSWRLQFVVLAFVAGIITLVIASLLPETLSPQLRRRGGIVDTARTMRSMVRDRMFVVNAVTCGLAAGVMWAYVGGATFALQNVYGLSAQQFALVFTLNGMALVIGSQINAHTVARYGSIRLLTVGVAGMALGGMTLVVAVLLGHAPLALVLVCLFVVAASNGFVSANAMALAMNDFPHAAGTAAALVGVLQYSIGAVAAPLTGLAGPSNALPMAIVMGLCGLAAAGIRVVARDLLVDHSTVAVPELVTIENPPAV